MILIEKRTHLLWTGIPTASDTTQRMLYESYSLKFIALSVMLIKHHNAP